MHNFLVNIALLLHADRHASHQVVAVALRFDTRHVLHNSLVGTRTTTAIGDLRSTVDGAENRVYPHEIIVLDGLEERCVRLEIGIWIGNEPASRNER